MKLSTFKQHLGNLEQICFQLPTGEQVPAHFHVTEVGQIHKTFIDCGGTLRNEQKVAFQLWEANDYDHRLHPEKLSAIITLAEEQMQLSDQEIEVEYQGTTIEKYGVAFEAGTFLLTAQTTDCLAPDKCGIPPQKVKRSLASLTPKPNNCTPGSGCC